MRSTCLGHHYHRLSTPKKFSKCQNRAHMLRSSNGIQASSLKFHGCMQPSVTAAIGCLFLALKVQPSQVQGVHVLLSFSSQLLTIL